MARCNCAGGSCSCVIQGSGSIRVDGAGSEVNPYVISGGGAVTVNDTPSINLTLTGEGSTLDPYVISGVATLALDALTDVLATGGSTGYVLAKQADGTFGLNPPATATPGLIAHDASLLGDGSAGNTLKVSTAWLDAYLGGTGGDLSSGYATQDQLTNLSLIVDDLTNRLQTAEERLAALPMGMYYTTISINPIPKTATSVWVTFPDGMFASDPRVFVTANTSVPGERVQEVSAWGVTPQGCNVAIYRDNSVSTGIFVLAIDSASVPQAPTSDVLIIDGGVVS